MAYKLNCMASTDDALLPVDKSQVVVVLHRHNGLLSIMVEDPGRLLHGPVQLPHPLPPVLEARHRCNKIARSPMLSKI